MLALAVDQLLWWVDIACLAVTGKFAVGVCSYLARPANRTPARLLTSWHHLWFVPLVVWVRRAVSQATCSHMRVA